MTANIAELQVKSGKVKELCKALHDNLQIWTAQPGFVDQIVLADEDANHVITQSYWQSDEHAQNFDRDYRARLTELFKEFLSAPPRTLSRRVAISTNQKLGAESGLKGAS